MLHRRLPTPDAASPWGSFKLGRAGVPVTILAIAHSAFCAFFSVCLATPKPHVGGVTYDILVFGAAVIFSLSFWFLYSRKY